MYIVSETSADNESGVFNGRDWRLSWLCSGFQPRACGCLVVRVVCLDVSGLALSYVYFHVIRASLSLLLMKFPRDFCTLVAYLLPPQRGSSCVKAPKKRGEKMKERKKEKKSKKLQCSAIWLQRLLQPPCVHFMCSFFFVFLRYVYCHSQTFRLSDFPTFDFQPFSFATQLGSLSLLSASHPQLTLIDICRCLHLPAIFHLDFISHFGWPSSLLSVYNWNWSSEVLSSALTHFGWLSNWTEPLTSI